MRALTLSYHDVVTAGDLDASGFAGPAAARYKLDADVFKRHIEEIAAASGRPVLPATAITSPSRPEQPTGVPLLLTFDDGGTSTLSHIAPLLEAFGWVGNFFITAQQIGKPGFLASHEIRELHRRGHVIGSHSYSHPRRMSVLSRAALDDEWSSSLEVLSRVLHDRVQTASVPGGYYSDRVAASAAETGIRILFTSEPTTRIRKVDNCLVLGRYTLLRRSTPDHVRRLLSRSAIARVADGLRWNAKKPFKVLGGVAYLKLQDLLLGENPRSA